MILSQSQSQHIKMLLKEVLKWYFHLVTRQTSFYLSWDLISNKDKTIYVTKWKVLYKDGL